jgi:hypothetical protein
MKTKKRSVDPDIAAIADEISEDIGVNNGLTRVEQDVVAIHPHRHRPEESTETLNEIMRRRLMASSESEFNSQRFGTFDPPLRREVVLPRAAGKTTMMEQMIARGMKQQTSQATVVVENKASMSVGNLGSRKLSL